MANKLLWMLMGAGSFGLLISLVFLVINSLDKYKKASNIILVLSFIILGFVSVSWCFFDYWK
jgi:hypothetical protein